MDMVEVGKKYRIDYGKGNLNNQLIHIRAKVDDEYYVYKVWFKRINNWKYFLENEFYFKRRIDSGNLKEVK